MRNGDLQARTRLYALRAIQLVEALPRSRAADVIGRQLLRCAISVGANCRAACRPKSAADFISKMEIVEEEADEILYWLDLLAESGLVREEEVADLVAEGNELRAMTVASIETARMRR